jgi:glycosyltransferase involved in cell wall biosynthesis
MPNVLILLSTWNGMTFLPEQIESLFAQQFDGKLSILVRDDGSTDGTVAYLRGLGDRVSVIEGENVGPRASFFELLRLARGFDADVFALCDQDDVWRPEKIACAIRNFDAKRPSLYASAVQLVDEQLEPISTYVHPGNRSFVSTLVCNYITGCTCVFNRAFLDQLCFPEDVGKVIMHDWWLASMATIDADIHYDRQSMIAYRQHASNHVGISNGIAAITAKVRRALSEKPAVTRFDHARQLRTAAGSRLNTQQRRILDSYLASEHSAVRRSVFALRHLRAIGLQAALRLAVFG